VRRVAVCDYVNRDYGGGILQCIQSVAKLGNGAWGRGKHAEDAHHLVEPRAR
jgi:hypothetical protein